MIMGWINKGIDKHFEQKGFKIWFCDKYGACYIKFNKNPKYNNVIRILHRNNGIHLFQMGSENENAPNGIPISLLFWVWLKYKWLSHKYNWKRMQNYYDSQIR